MNHFNVSKELLEEVITEIKSDFIKQKKWEDYKIQKEELYKSQAIREVATKYQEDSPLNKSFDTPYGNAEVTQAKFTGKEFTNEEFNIKEVNSFISDTYKANVNFIRNQHVGVIGDQHFPFDKEGYIDWCYDTFREYKVNKVINIGDVVDNHATSYHETDPDGQSAGDEYSLALKKCLELYKMFPEVDVCIGNHDAIPYRKLFSAGLPKQWMKTYQELLMSPIGWKWDFTHIHDNVIYNHGTGKSGELAAINFANANRASTVIGHLHSVSSVTHSASYKDIIFGMSVGCGIDRHKYAFGYGRDDAKKQIVGAGVVLNNGTLPINLIMPL